MEVELSEETRDAVLRHVLSEVHPDRLEAEVVATAPRGNGFWVGVKVAPRGYISNAKYALVTVEDGAVVAAEACTGDDIRQSLSWQ